MFEQHAFQFERADAVVGRFEDVVGTADEGEIALVIGEHHVAAAIEIAIGAAELAVVALIALHQAGGPVGAEHQRHLAFLGDVAVAVGDLHAIARQRTAHRADLDLLARRIAGERRGFGLAVAVADGQAPGRLHLIDHFGIERLAGAADLAQARP